jgi:hypothetical protein
MANHLGAKANRKRYRLLAVSAAALLVIAIPALMKAQSPAAPPLAAAQVPSAAAPHRPHRRAFAELTMGGKS